MNKIKTIVLLIIIFSFGSTQVYPQSISENYKLVTDVFDESGGPSQSINFKVKVSSTGQPSPTGEEVSTNFKMRGGYVYSLSVLHGDANADGSVNSADVAWLINYLFISGPEPILLEAGDVNGDRIINSSDIAYLINYLFVDGPPPGDSPKSLSGDV
jgi:hypothetical protein